MTQDDLPWGDPMKWTPGYWYPLPFVDEVKYRQSSWLEVESGSWVIFMLDPNAIAEGDITSIDADLTFTEAIRICNAHNAEILWTLPK